MARWTDKEIEILNKYSSKEELEKLIPHRTWRAIRAKRVEIGLGAESREVWTDKEIQALKECKSISQAKEMFPARTESAILKQIERLDLNIEGSKKKWKAQETDKLREFISIRPSAEELLETFPHRSLESIRKKLHKLRKESK